MVDGRDNPFNEVNPGIGYTTDHNWMIGFYHNSYDSITVYTGKRFERGKVGLELGMSVYGNYRFNENQILPIGQLTYDIGDVRFGFSPGNFINTYGLVTFQYIIR